jgi:hypothetical protein
MCKLAFSISIVEATKKILHVLSLRYPEFAKPLEPFLDSFQYRLDADSAAKNHANLSNVMMSE